MDGLKEKTAINYGYLLLPFAFLLHNFEEILGIEEWLKKIPLPVDPIVSTKQFAIAAVIFTIIGFLATFSKIFFKTDKKYDFLMTAFAGMIFLNVFFPHLIATIAYGTYAPGVLTAVFINLPLTLYIFFANIKTENLTLNQTVNFIIIGGLVGVCIIPPLLKMGEILAQIF
jgi:hypothetical protein